MEYSPNMRHSNNNKVGEHYSGFYTATIAQGSTFQEKRSKKKKKKKKEREREREIKLKSFTTVAFPS